MSVLLWIIITVIPAFFKVLLFPSISLSLHPSSSPAYFLSPSLPRSPDSPIVLFIARDEADLLGWVEAINRAIQAQDNSNPLSASAHFRKYTYVHVHVHVCMYVCIPTSWATVYITVISECLYTHVHVQDICLVMPSHSALLMYKPFPGVNYCQSM